MDVLVINVLCLIRRFDKSYIWYHSPEAKILHLCEAPVQILSIPNCTKYQTEI